MLGGKRPSLVQKGSEEGERKPARKGERLTGKKVQISRSSGDEEKRGKKIPDPS